MTRAELLGATTGLIAGAGVAGVVATLLGRLATTVGEIDRYATDIAEQAGHLVDNLDGAVALSRTGDLAAEVRSLVARGGRR